jgi:cytoskeletal protein RodZ
MESLGVRLRDARKEKGLSIDQISRDTNISVRFIEALEAENFEIFPGEPYIIGFLRNYSSYLELDVQKTISLYKALRIQEQPIPVDKLLRAPIRIPSFLLPAIFILILVGAGSFGVYSLIVNRQNRPVSSNIPAARTPVEYLMEGSSMDRRFYIGDSLMVSLDSETHKVELYNLSETVTIRTPGGQEILDLSQEVTIDLNNDGVPDLRITVVDFAKNNPEMGTLLHFQLMDTSVLASAEAEPESPFVRTTTTAASTTIIPSSPNAYPFTLQVNFNGFCMFRWEILHERDRRGTNQRYFQRNTSLDIQAQNGIRIWASNATAARFQVIGGGRTFPVELGTAGEVVVAEIRWVRDDDGRYRVVLIRLET